MEHWIVVACIVLQCLHILTSNPSLQGIGNWCRDWTVQDFQSLHALLGAVYLEAPLLSLLGFKS